MPAVPEARGSLALAHMTPPVGLWMAWAAAEHPCEVRGRVRGHGPIRQGRGAH
jgi:hypothetical protein